MERIYIYIYKLQVTKKWRFNMNDEKIIEQLETFELPVRE